MKLLTILTVLICLTTFAQTKKENVNHQTTNPNLNVDTSKIAILHFDTAQNWIFKKALPTVLTTVDFIEIETLIENCIDEYNVEKEREFLEMKSKSPNSKIRKDYYVIDIKRYKRQYVTVINEKGEKEEWINCFCNSWDINWKKEIIGVEDGGNCYFNLKINLTMKVYYDLMVNGNA